MSSRIVVLPGDGIGPEVAAEAVRVLEALPLDLEIEERLFGGAAIDAVGDPLPADTLAACRSADAVLLGAVGGPKWDGGSVRPEAGLLGIRKELDVYANLRPAVGEGVDMLIVRELVGGLYFGARGVRDDGTVFDTCEYHPDQVERVARRAFELAREPLGPAALGRQGERPRHLADVAAGRVGAGGGVPRRRAAPRARRQRRDVRSSPTRARSTSS